MEKKDEAKENRELLNSLVKAQLSTKAMQKLNREPLKVSVYRHMSAIEELEVQKGLIEDALLQVNSESDEAKQLVQKRDEIEVELKKLEVDKIEGTLTNLSYRDVNDIKAAITEAVVHYQEYKFDPEVIWARVIAEERFMTVFCALKQVGSLREKYFTNLDDLILVEERVIYALHRQWEEHFVLTEEELKN